MFIKCFTSQTMKRIAQKRKICDVICFLQCESIEFKPVKQHVGIIPKHAHTRVCQLDLNTNT